MKEIASLFKFPATMVPLGIIPVVNCLFYSVHTGLGGIILPFCTPYVLVRFAMFMLHQAQVRRFYLKFGSVALIMYIVVLYPRSSLVVGMMNSCPGMEIKQYEFYKVIAFPLGLAVPPYGEANRQAIEHGLGFLFP